VVKPTNTNETFINDSFLLYTSEAERLYHEYAKHMPIIDYHNHLNPSEIAGHRKFKNLSEVWLHGDHYKWRAMRAHGISEKYITGGASDAEKFEQWAATVPYTVRNPLYHWTHLELKRYFGIEELLSSRNQASIYQSCNEQLNSENFSTVGLLNQMNVKFVGTTDDPLDSLEHHLAIKNDASHSIRVSPSFRPDKFILIENGMFSQHILKLSELSNIEIKNYDDLLAGLKARIAFFKSVGCLASDHGLAFIPTTDFTTTEVNNIFKNTLAGSKPSYEEEQKYKSSILLDLARMYHDAGWAQQYHLGALRNNNTRALATLGADTGWDSIGDWQQAESLSKFMNTLSQENKLTKTIIYNLNPADNEVFASMIGNFNEGDIRGKIQHGSGWWFLDQKDGMEKQINALSNMGLISAFVGMLTDSRSFLSFPRHEYFRRILCNLFGKEMKDGELPQDFDHLGGIIQDICYYNAARYFGLNQTV
jgi:glucuronate isomerase